MPAPSRSRADVRVPAEDLGAAATAMGANPVAAGLLGSYGERLMGSVKTNVSSNWLVRYVAGVEFTEYFAVDAAYLRRKLKMVLLPFAHRGSWSRLCDGVAGGLRFKSPREDVNAPDLYLPLMAMCAHCVLRAASLGVEGEMAHAAAAAAHAAHAATHGELAVDGDLATAHFYADVKRFNPSVMSDGFNKALFWWVAQACALKATVYVLGSQQLPLKVAFMDLMAYTGYIFVGIALSGLLRPMGALVYRGVLLYSAVMCALFLLRTLKRAALWGGAHQGAVDAAKVNYVLLCAAAAQVAMVWLMSY